MAQTIKILTIGDFHGKFPAKLKKEARKADFILSTGDYGGSDRLLKIIFQDFYIDWTERVGPKRAREMILEDYSSGKKIIRELDQLGKRVYAIAGNWDFEERKRERFGSLKLKRYSELMKSSKNINFIDRKIINIQGVKVYGFGGMVTAYVYLTKQGGFEKGRIKIYRKHHEKERKLLFRKQNKDIDILVTHYPPYGYFDKVIYKGKNPMKGKHIGFRPYVEFIKRNKPQVFVCGHMHEYQGMKKIGKTLVIATGSAKQGKAAWIEIDEQTRKLKRVRFLR